MDHILLKHHIMSHISTNDNSNTNIALATVFVSYAMKKLNIDMMYYGIFYGLVLNLLTNITYGSFLHPIDYIYHNIYYLFVSIIIGALFFIFYPTIKNIVQFYFTKTYVTININNNEQILLFTKYVSYNSKYYDNMVTINIGDIDKKMEMLLYDPTGKNATFASIDESKITSQEIDKQINFNDEYLGINGYYVWRKINKNSQDLENKILKQVTIKYIELNIVKNTGIDPSDIIKKINDFVHDTDKNDIVLRYIKIINVENGTKNHEIIFHSGQKSNIETLEEKFMKPFFHQEKDMLWSVIKNVCLNPNFYETRGQVARINLLLYGPPGSGKSTFAYRIAMCLYRHIISLELRGISKTSIYQILHRPCICEKFHSYRDVLFLFEEFDISVHELYLRELYFKMRDKNIMKYINNIDEFNDNEFIDTENKSKKNNPTYTANDFKLRDLLEIFQGSVPFESMIIIANTNKYDEIKTMCPELFRPGRLTPIYFGYINKETLQEISLYFFKKKLTGYIPNILTIPTSQIIEIAFESITLDKKNAFNYFSSKIFKLLA